MGDYFQQRKNFAAAFSWVARFNSNEAVAHQFLLALNHEGARFITKPNQNDFSRIRANDIVELDANDLVSPNGPDTLDLTA